MAGRIIGRLTGTGRVDYGEPAGDGDVAGPRSGESPMETGWQIEERKTVGGVSYRCWFPSNLEYRSEENARQVLDWDRKEGREVRLVKVTREVIE
jgi:hypothetical protein